METIETLISIGFKVEYWECNEDGYYVDAKTMINHYKVHLSKGNDLKHENIILSINTTKDIDEQLESASKTC